MSKNDDKLTSKIVKLCGQKFIFRGDLGWQPLELQEHIGAPLGFQSIGSTIADVVVKLAMFLTFIKLQKSTGSAEPVKPLYCLF